MFERSLISLVEAAAQARNQPPVPRQFIEEALRRINAGEEEVSRYPMGSPSLRGIYDIAARLEGAVAVKN